MVDYETLRLIWWGLLGVLLIGFAVMNGFDMGVATLLPIVGKNDDERRIIINTVGPVWEGNQVWLILGGGASFAAWPPLYAVSFSGFYFAIFLALFTIVLRPVGFKFRSKLANPTWRSLWDSALFLGGFVPMLVFGVAFGNLFLGAPYYFDDSMQIFYTGDFWRLFTPFTILTGLTAIAMSVMHGGIYLAIKTESPIAERARRCSLAAAIVLLGVFSAAGWMIAHYIDGLAITSTAVTEGPSNPLLKTVELVKGGWMHNYSHYPLMWLAPLMVYGGTLGAVCLLYLNRAGLAFISSSLAITGVIATAGGSLFPFLMPSSSRPSHSLTVWDASSSQSTLFVMTIAAVIFVPLILAYTAWVYRVLRGKVTTTTVEGEASSY